MLNKNIIGFAAYSGTGKTTLIKELVNILNNTGYNVSVIKHAHHDFDTDHPGKDSYEIRKAGSTNILVSSKKRWALIHENKNTQEPSLQDLVDLINNIKTDIILVEGFKLEDFPKIELYRKDIGKGFLYENDMNIVAIASDEKINISRNIEELDINNPHQIVDYIIKYLKLSK